MLMIWLVGQDRCSIIKIEKENLLIILQGYHILTLFSSIIQKKGTRHYMYSLMILFNRFFTNCTSISNVNFFKKKKKKRSEREREESKVNFKCCI